MTLSPSEALLTKWLLTYFYQRLPFPQEWLPQKSYWVGGSLRDAYLAWLQGRAAGDPARDGGMESSASVDLDLMCAVDPVG